MAKETVIRFRATGRLKNKVHAMAKMNGQGISDYVRDLCVSAIAVHEAKHGPIKISDVPARKHG